MALYRERFHSRYFLAVTFEFQFVPVARPELQRAVAQAFFSVGLPEWILPSPAHQEPSDLREWFQS